jgi:preprotein translocase subunit SecA
MADIEDLCIRTVPEKVFHDVFKQIFADGGMQFVSKITTTRDRDIHCGGNMTLMVCGHLLVISTQNHIENRFRNVSGG